MLRLQQYRPWVALCSAVLFIVLGEAGVYEFSLRAALQAVDYNVLLMMAGTMGTVALFIESKMPARLAEMLIVRVPDVKRAVCMLSLIHISEPTRRTPISYAVFCLKKKKKTSTKPSN